jgi:hypothetical protein
MHKQSFLIIGVAILLVASIVTAQVPQRMNYQGKLTDGSGNPVSNGTYSVQFTIYTAASGGSGEWSEVRNVTTADGLFSIELGSVSPITSATLDGSERWLGIKIGSDPEIVPRERLVSAPYALRAGEVDGVTSTGWVDDGSVVRLESSSDFVGIGTSSPATRLEVRSPGSTQPVFRFGDGFGYGNLIAGSGSISIATQDGTSRFTIRQTDGNIDSCMWIGI